MDHLLGLFDRLMRSLHESAADRHDFLARWLDYLPERIPIYIFMNAIGVITAVLIQELSMLVGLGFVGLFRWADHKPSMFLVVIWEMFTWLYVIAVPIAAFSLIVGDPEHNLPKTMAIVVLWVVLMYLLMDISQPPRPRKKVRLPAREKVPEMGTIAT